MQLSSELIPQTMETVAEMAEEAKGYIDRIYLHWTAGHYGQIYDDYHVSIDHDGRVYFPDNCADFTAFREHTYRRNSRAIGIAVCGCFDACANSGYNLTMGTEPVTPAQIETMSVMVATICKHAGIDINDVYTHCEIARIDGYGPFSGDPQTRWDLWFLPDGDRVTGYKMVPGGDVIRGKAVWYNEHYDL